jgi:hypothetical protein
LARSQLAILPLFAGLLQAAQPDRHDVLTNTSKALTDERPFQRTTQTYLCLNIKRLE